MSWLCEHEPTWFQSLRVGGRTVLPAIRREALVGDRRTFILVSTILGSSMTFIDGTVVNVALPTIGRDLDLGLAGRQWVFLSYSLVLASLYLPAGAVADRFGDRRVFLAGVAGFGIASAITGVSPSGAFLIGARALQGAAGAFLAIGSLALLRSTYGRESGRAVGLWTAWTGITTLAGPPLGGALVEWASWRWIFYINIPLAVAAAALTVRVRMPVTDEVVSERRPLDVVGSVLFAAGFGLLTYGLVEAGASGLSSSWWALAGGVAALAGGLLYEARTSRPMLPLSLFRRRNFGAANGETLLVYAGLGGSTFFLVLYLQSVAGYTPFQSSLVMVPISLIMLLLAGRFGRLSDQHGPRLYLSGGPIVMAAGMLLWILVTGRDDWLPLAAGVVVFGVGLSITVAPITATALQAAPTRLAGVAAGVNNTVSRVGGLIAVALIGLVIAQVFAASAGPGHAKPLTGAAPVGVERQASIDGFRAGIALAAFLCLGGAAVGVFGVSNSGRADDVGSARREEDRDGVGDALLGR
jgi:EmrB/QacA subfamily drug resistance transporter